MSPTGQGHYENVTYIHNGTLFNQEKEYLTFSAKQIMETEDAISSEINKSDAEKQNNACFL